MLVVGQPSADGLLTGTFTRDTDFGADDWRARADKISSSTLFETFAIAIANDTIYGLNASVFTSDPERADAVARRLRAGTVGHNACKPDFSISFGGVKQSGIGRDGGTEGVYPYLEAKAVILDQPASKAS